MKDKDTDSIINGYKKYMKDNEISDKDIETATSYVKPFVQFLLEKQEHIIDYPKDEKGKSKRNMTEEEKKTAQKKSEEIRRNKGQERKETSRITGRLKRALDFSNALVYNLLRK